MYPYTCIFLRYFLSFISIIFLNVILVGNVFLIHKNKQKTPPPPKAKTKTKNHQTCIFYLDMLKETSLKSTVSNTPRWIVAKMGKDKSFCLFVFCFLKGLSSDMLLNRFEQFPQTVSDLWRLRILSLRQYQIKHNYHCLWPSFQSESVFDWMEWEQNQQNTKTTSLKTTNKCNPNERKFYPNKVTSLDINCKSEILS